MGEITTVNFRNDTLFAVKQPDGVYVAIAPICQRLGLDTKGQRDRINRDTILREGRVMMPLPSISGMQETLCLRLDLLNGWLFGIDENRVKDEETRELVLTYKRECYSVLNDHFFGSRKLTVVEEPLVEAKESESLSLRKVNEARQVFGNQAAAQLWFKLGLDVVPAMLQDTRQAELFTYTAIKAAPEAGAKTGEAA